MASSSAAVFVCSNTGGSAENDETAIWGVREGRERVVVRFKGRAYRSVTGQSRVRLSPRDRTSRRVAGSARSGHRNFAERRVFRARTFRVPSSDAVFAASPDLCAFLNASSVFFAVAMSAILPEPTSRGVE